MLPVQVEVNNSSQTETKDSDDKVINSENKDTEIEKAKVNDEDNIALENNLNS